MRPELQMLKKTCANGLRVILVRKPDYQKSLFMMGINAGGLNQKETQDGKLVCHPTGCAHYLEHQMFRLNGEDVTQALAEEGAYTNAMTNYNNTFYYVKTSGEIWKPLELLMDFVQHLEITDETVNKEKGIILSEYNMYHQQPESRILEEVQKNLFREYLMNTDILGTTEDIQNMTAEDLQSFYNCFYDSSQTIFCGVTGKPLEPIMEFIEKHQENIARRMKGDVIPDYGKEPEEVVRPSSKLKMDVYIPYAALAVKMKPVDNVQENRRNDMMLTMWLMSVFSPLNPEYQTWMDERIMTPLFSSECDLSEHHAIVMVLGQTEKPEEFLALVKKKLEEKQPISESVFRSLQIRNLAGFLRGLDDFEDLCLSLITGTFDGTDPMEEEEIIRSLSAEEVNCFVQSLDFSNMTEVVIEPLESEEQ